MTRWGNPKRHSFFVVTLFSLHFGPSGWHASFRDRKNPRGPNDQNKFNLARTFQSRSKFLVSLENFNLDASNSPTKNRASLWLARKFHSRSKFSISLGISNFFDLWALWDHDSQRRDRILRFFFNPRMGQFSPHYGAISLLNYT